MLCKNKNWKREELLENFFIKNFIEIILLDVISTTHTNAQKKKKWFIINYNSLQL